MAQRVGTNCKRDSERITTDGSLSPDFLPIIAQTYRVSSIMGPQCVESRGCGLWVTKNSS